MADEVEDHDQEGREQDHLLPIANIGRIMKSAVPGSAKISKDAKETVQECVSEFISFITSEANDKCLQEKRKTINGDDLVHAMKTLGFDNYVDPLSTYLSRYKEVLNAEAAAESMRPARRRDGLEMTDAQGDMAHPVINMPVANPLAGGLEADRLVPEVARFHDPAVYADPVNLDGS